MGGKRCHISSYHMYPAKYCLFLSVHSHSFYFNGTFSVLALRPAVFQPASRWGRGIIVYLLYVLFVKKLLLSIYLSDLCSSRASIYKSMRQPADHA